MANGAGRITYPLVMIVVVGTTWCVAWARSVNDQSARGYWPAKDPELMRRVLASHGESRSAEDLDLTEVPAR
jgi:hypothetical protein